MSDNTVMYTSRAGEYERIEIAWDGQRVEIDLKDAVSVALRILETRLCCSGAEMSADERPRLVYMAAQALRCAVEPEYVQTVNIEERFAGLLTALTP
jgi:hypothetical protein